MAKPMHLPRDHYADITQQIIALMESGHLNLKNDLLSDGFPYNASTKRQYNGINLLMLVGVKNKFGYQSNGWLTFNQVKELGGHVRKGEKGAPIAFFSQITAEAANESGEEEKKIPFLKKFIVFNVEQCDNLPENIACLDAVKTDFVPMAEIDVLAEKMGVNVIHDDGNRIFYSPSRDTVTIPHPENFVSTANYYASLLHELIHATGNKSRLARDFSGRFGSEAYAFEELVAELGAAFLCGDYGLIDATVENHAAYLQNWLQILKDDKKAIFHASSKAGQAAQYLRDCAAMETTKAA